MIACNKAVAKNVCWKGIFLGTRTNENFGHDSKGTFHVIFSVDRKEIVNINYDSAILGVCNDLKAMISQTTNEINVEALNKCFLLNM